MQTHRNIVHAIKIGFDILFFAAIFFLLVSIASTFIGISDTNQARTLSNLPIKVTPIDHTHLTTEELNPAIHAEADIIDSFIYLRLSGGEASTMPALLVVLQLLIANIYWLILVYLLFKVRQIVHTVYNTKKQIQQPLSSLLFSEKNSRRFRLIAITFFCIPLIELLIYFVDMFFFIPYLKSLLIFPGYDIKAASSLFDVSWDYFFVGLFLLIIVEIIRKGTQLQEENDLTV